MDTLTFTLGVAAFWALALVGLAGQGTWVPVAVAAVVAGLVAVKDAA